MIPYIGDISKQDAVVLKELAGQSEKTLEFGCGASTQVLTAYTTGSVVSVETDPVWIRKTEAHIQRMGLPNVTFCLYEDFVPVYPYDLVFNDGTLGLRHKFAMSIWKHVKVGGVLCFHDTRTTGVILNVAKFFSIYSAEIHSIIVNKDHSNTTVIRKKVAEHYENWNLVESKEEWQVGR